VELPRPRNRVALAEDATYNHIRQEVLQFLYEKQQKVQPLQRSEKAPAAAESAQAATGG